MDYLKTLYAVVPVIIAVILHMYKDAFLAVIRAKTITDFEDIREKHMIISVLSSRGNFDRRKAIRDTWWGYVKKNYEVDTVELKFIIGQPCMIPPGDRKDEYTCESWTYKLPDYFEDIPLFVQYFPPPSVDDGISSGIKQPRFSFRVHHSVIISKLGILEGCIGNSTIVVKLVDAMSDSEIVSATFTRESPGVLIQGYHYKPVEPYVLSPGYEGIISVTKHDVTWESRINCGSEISGVSQLNTNASGIIELYADNSVIEDHYVNNRADGGLITLASFLYHIHDVTSTKRLIDEKEKRALGWLDQVKQEELKLRKELEDNGDLLFVSTTDVYRNIPEKLMQALQHYRATPFRFFLKVDDDIFLDIESVLREGLVEQSRTWIGRFRHNWAVERYGKWAERDYESLTYPPFACGSAYVLSSDLARWLPDNAHLLKRFQGEDVSMGIWLSGIDVRREDSPRWGCEEDCVPGRFSIPQLSPTHLRLLWHNWRTCRNPCAC